MKYVDYLFGKFISELKRQGRYEDATIVVLSDHNFRIMAHKEEWNKIPLIVKRGNKLARKDILKSVHAEEILHSLLDTQKKGYSESVRNKISY